MSDAPLTDCPDCGEAELRRLVSAAAFRLKGSGWYETDFKKGRKKNLHGAESASKDESKKTTNGKAAGTDAKKTATKANSASTDAA